MPTPTRRPRGPRHLAAAWRTAGPHSRMLLAASAAAILLVAVASWPGGHLPDADAAAHRSTARPAGTAAQPAPGPPPRRFTLAATGDLLIHDQVMAAAATAGGYDFRPKFADVAPILSGADLAICHLEVPLGRDGETFRGYPAFLAPPQLAPAVADAGFDACSTASNHTLDHGTGGVTSTLDALDAAGVAHTGTARSAAEAATPTILDAGGVRVALLSYTYGLNGYPRPADKPWLVNLIDPARIRADARAARQAGAEFVVVLLHAGDEGQTAPSAQQRQLADTLLAAPGIDLLMGHHAHVVQPIEQVHGKWAVFGMGNFLSNQTPACCAAGSQDGMIAHVTVAETDTGLEVERVGYVPTWVEHPGHVIRVALDGHPGPPDALAAARARTAAAVGPHAEVLDPSTLERRSPRPAGAATEPGTAAQPGRNVRSR